MEAPEQASFLEADLARSDARWKLVAFHVPYYNCRSTGTGYASEIYLRDWASIIEDPEYKVDLVVTGHVHNYMRSFPLRTKIEEVPLKNPWTNVGYRAIPEIAHTSEEGVSYIVQGGWGAPADPYMEWGRCKVRDFMAAYTSVHSYTLIELEHGKLYLSTRDLNKKVYDEQVFPYYLEEEEPVASEEKALPEEGEKGALLATKIKEEGRGALAAKDGGGVLPACIESLQTVSQNSGDITTCSPCIRATYDMAGLVAG
jgi:3',5'-cyclic AMP phosphodiesterase CpdA